MTQRDEVYHQFGPLQEEALFDTILGLVNENRTALGKSPLPKDAFLGMAHNAAAHLEPYDWMSEET